MHPSPCRSRHPSPCRSKLPAPIPQGYYQRERAASLQPRRHSQHARRHRYVPRRLLLAAWRMDDKNVPQSTHLHAFLAVMCLGSHECQTFLCDSSAPYCRHRRALLCVCSAAGPTETAELDAITARDTAALPPPASAAHVDGASQVDVTPGSTEGYASDSSSGSESGNEDFLTSLTDWAATRRRGQMVPRQQQRQPTMATSAQQAAQQPPPTAQQNNTGRPHTNSGGSCRQVAGLLSEQTSGSQASAVQEALVMVQGSGMRSELDAGMVDRRASHSRASTSAESGARAVAGLLPAERQPRHSGGRYASDGTSSEEEEAELHHRAAASPRQPLRSAWQAISRQVSRRTDALRRSVSPPSHGTQHAQGSAGDDTAMREGHTSGLARASAPADADQAWNSAAPVDSDTVHAAPRAASAIHDASGLPKHDSFSGTRGRQGVASEQLLTHNPSGSLLSRLVQMGPSEATKAASDAGLSSEGQAEEARSVLQMPGVARTQEEPRRGAMYNEDGSLFKGLYNTPSAAKSPTTVPHPTFCCAQSSAHCTLPFARVHAHLICETRTHATATGRVLQHNELEACNKLQCGAGWDMAQRAWRHRPQPQVAAAVQHGSLHVLWRCCWYIRGARRAAAHARHCPQALTSPSQAASSTTDCVS